MSQRFQLIDTDKDGFLTMDEFFQYGLGEEEKKHMMEMDTNGDEKISRDELYKYLSRGLAVSGRMNRSYS